MITYHWLLLVISSIAHRARSLTLLFGSFVSCSSAWIESRASPPILPKAETAASRIFGFVDCRSCIYLSCCVMLVAVFTTDEISAPQYLQSIASARTISAQNGHFFDSAELSATFTTSAFCLGSTRTSIRPNGPSRAPAINQPQPLLPREFAATALTIPNRNHSMMYIISNTLPCSPRVHASCKAGSPSATVSEASSARGSPARRIASVTINCKQVLGTPFLRTH